MNILLLGPERPELTAYLDTAGDHVVRRDEKITADSPVLDTIDFIVSYGYRYILKDDLLNRFPNRVINLHISYLPWNRGADPNLWSFLEDTPKGVTIHYIDAGIDTGRLLAQRKVAFGSDETLKTSYDKLSSEIERLFREVWPEIRDGQRASFPQPKGGSFHRTRDRAAVNDLLTEGWDTKVGDLIGMANRVVR